MVDFRECWAEADQTAGSGPALVSAVVSADGTVLELDLARDSGSVALDTCALAAFGEATLAPPPPETLAEDGTLTTPSMAFLPLP